MSESFFKIRTHLALTSHRVLRERCRLARSQTFGVARLALVVAEILELDALYLQHPVLVDTDVDVVSLQQRAFVTQPGDGRPGETVDITGEECRVFEVQNQTARLAGKRA